MRCLHRAALLGTLAVSVMPCGLAHATPSWLSPVVFEDSAVAGVPTLGMTATGDTYAGWLSHQDYKASLRPAGGEFTALPADATFARVASDAAGDATLVSLAGGVLQLRDRRASGELSAAEDLAVGTPEAIAMNATGDTAIVWLEDTKTGADVSWRLRSVRRRPGGQSQEPQTIASGVGPREPTLSLAIDQSGDAVAVWRSWDGVYSSAVNAARLPVGGSWEAPVQLDADATPLYVSDGRERVSVAADPVGWATAAWVRNEQGAAPELRASDRSPLDVWNASAPIASPAASDHLVMSDDGTTIAAWTVPATAPAKPQVAVAVRAPGATWTAAQTLATNALAGTDVALAASPRGDAVVVWRGGTPLAVQAARRPRGSNLFGATVNLGPLDPTKPNGAAPQVAMDDEGNAFAMWSAGMPFVNSSPRFSVQGAALDAAGPSQRTLYIPPAGTQTSRWA